MTKRKIIQITEDKCDGCGNCIPNCPEGALQVIEGKARLISDLFCDGLGACIGECPSGAITITEREAQPYSEREVMANMVKQGKKVILAHLKHLEEHNETALYKEALDYLKKNNIDILPGPGKQSKSKPTLSQKKEPLKLNQRGTQAEISPMEVQSRLSQWPVQIMLVPPAAPFFRDADLLISADCVPFAYAGFHQDLLQGKVLLVGCPKLDDSQYYLEKLTGIFTSNDIKSVTVAHMEVPCCFGLVSLVKKAIMDSGKKIELKEVNVSIKGSLHKK